VVGVRWSADRQTDHISRVAQTPALLRHVAPCQIAKASHLTKPFLSTKFGLAEEVHGQVRQGVQMTGLLCGHHIQCSFLRIKRKDLQMALRAHSGHHTDTLFSSLRPQPLVFHHSESFNQPIPPFENLSVRCGSHYADPFLSVLEPMVQCICWVLRAV
jgi:hypothetical protein